MSKAQFNWVTQDRAVEMLHHAYTPLSLQIFTRNEKRKKLPIRTKKLGKKILYSGSDIESFINS
jgi:hypothetical protein